MTQKRTTPHTAWSELHTEAQRLAVQAARQRGDSDRALSLFLEAADKEVLALAELDTSKARTIAITAVSAASLYFKAGAHQKAEQLACRYLADPNFHDFGRRELKGILQNIWELDQ